VTAARGSSVELSIEVQPGFAYEYQWRRGEVPRPIAGANDARLTLTHVSRADAGVYDCVVTAAAVGCHTRRVFSAKALVNVCVADWDGDGFIEGSDYALFVAAFESGDLASDVTRDGFVDWFDYDTFVGAFEAGC
jgi:hypothetical protein